MNAMKVCHICSIPYTTDNGHDWDECHERMIKHANDVDRATKQLHERISAFNEQWTDKISLQTILISEKED